MQIQPTNNGFDNSTRDLRTGDGSQNASSGEVIREDDVQTHAPHSRVTELLSLMKDSGEFTEVREKRVTEVLDRLASGYYSSRVAAEQTAQRIG